MRAETTSSVLTVRLQRDNRCGSIRMKTRMSPICAVVEMNANAVGLTGVVRPSTTAFVGFDMGRR